MPAEDSSREGSTQNRPHGERRRRERLRRDRFEARRLDVPLPPRRRLGFEYDPELFGKFAEAFARFMGTARFLAYMTAFVGLWVTFNMIGLFGFRWDPYPFILLNLFFSTQASYAAPLILLAQNRQEARDRMQIDQDRDVQARTRADMEFLAREVASLRLGLGEVATRDYVRSELRALLQELDERSADRQHDGRNNAERPASARWKQSRESSESAGSAEPPPAPSHTPPAPPQQASQASQAQPQPGTDESRAHQSGQSGQSGA